MKAKKTQNIIMILAFAVIMLGLSIASIVMPDTKMSENENRVFTQKPELTVEALLNGEYEDKLEKYLSDQIAGRETWVQLRSQILKTFRANELNGTYVQKDGTLSEKISEEDFDFARFENNLAQVGKLFAKAKIKNVKSTFILVPSAAHIREVDLTGYDEEKALDMVREKFSDSFIDLAPVFKDAENKSELYFATDHHWSAFGAAKAGEIFTARKSYELTKLADDFHGTLYSKTLISTKSDTIMAPSDALNIKTSVNIDGKDYDSIFFNEYLNQKDKYKVFFGGNFGKIDIDVEDAFTDKSILIVKDSFANSFVPFIIREYSKITMIDTRYYRGHAADLIKDYDEVLVIYGINNFAEEKIVLS